MPDLVRVDLASFKAWKGDDLLDLKASDLRILALLVDNAGRAITHEQAFRCGWGNDRIVSTKAVVCSIFRIRAQIGDGYIETIRQVGYRFNPNMVGPSPLETVVIHGRRVEIMHWHKHPRQHSNDVQKWTLYGWPVEEPQHGWATSAYTACTPAGVPDGR